MSSGEGGSYRLTPAALQDLEHIWRYSAERWTVEHADLNVDQLVGLLENLAATPAMAREHTEFTPTARIFVHHEHVVVFTLYDHEIVIVRLLGARQDWVSLLRTAEL